MRDYRGVSYDRIEDLKSREAISTIDEFLRQLSFGIGNLNAGKRADSSGRPTTPVALDDYFYLPGRSGGQLGHGGNGASDPLTLASTRHPTKGSIYFGTARQSAFDELNSRLGINTPTPAAKLHIVTEAASSFGRPLADISVQHARIGGASNAACVNEVSSDGNSSYIVYNSFPNAIFTEVYSGSAFTYTGTASGFVLRTTLGKFGGDAVSRTWQHRVRLETTAGAALTADYDWDSTGVDAYATKEFTLTDPECVAVAAANAGAGYRFIYTAAYGGFGTPTSESRMTHLELQVSASTPTPLTYWDSGVTRMASVSGTGAGQFQNVLLEDPGAGTGTISLIAPTAVSSYSLTFPADDGAANELLQTNGAGVLDFVTLSGDATLVGGALTLANSGVSAGAYGSSTSVPTFTVDAKGRLTLAANVAIAFPGGLTGFAIPTVDVDITAEDAGVALTALRSDARLQLSQAITPTWTGAHTWTAAAAITAIQINQHASQSTNLLRVSSAAAVGDTFLRIGSTGEVFFGHNGGTQDDAVRKVLVRGNSTQSLDLIAIQTETTTISAFDAAARFKFFDSTGANSTTFDRTAAGSNHVLTWPASQGAADRYIRNDGAGALTWVQVSLTAGVTGTLPVGNGGTGNTTGTATINANLTGHVTSVGNAAVLGSFTSAQLLAALTDETGTGANVFATSPTLVTPLLGTPTSGVLTNCTGLPVAGGGTGVTSFTANGVLYGNAATSVLVTAQGAANTVLLGNGGVPTFGSVPAGAIPTHTGEVTGQTALTIDKTISPTWTGMHTWSRSDGNYQIKLNNTSGTPITYGWGVATAGHLFLDTVGGNRKLTIYDNGTVSALLYDGTTLNIVGTGTIATVHATIVGSGTTSPSANFHAKSGSGYQYKMESAAPSTVNVWGFGADGSGNFFLDDVTAAGRRLTFDRAGGTARLNGTFTIVGADTSTGYFSVVAGELFWNGPTTQTRLAIA